LKICGICINEGDFDEERIKVVQFEMDEFGETWIHMFGASTVPNYLHIWIAGHIRHFLRQYKNIYRLANHGFESKMTNVRTFRRRRTQQGSKMSLAAAMKKYILRSIAWFLESLSGGPSSGFIDKLWKQGRDILLKRRREDYAEKKRAAEVPLDPSEEEDDGDDFTEADNLNNNDSFRLAGHDIQSFDFNEDSDNEYDDV
jgi:hypothetical protein